MPVKPESVQKNCVEPPVFSRFYSPSFLDCEMKFFCRFNLSLCLCFVALCGAVGCGGSSENTVVEAPADPEAQRAAEEAYDKEMAARQSAGEN
jgi:hypothetical protein